MLGLLLTVCGALLGVRPLGQGGSGHARRASCSIRLVAPELPEMEIWTSLRRRIRSRLPSGAETNESPIEEGIQRAIQPLSSRFEGRETGMYYSDAFLASTTGPVFDREGPLDGQIMRPAQAIKGLYAAFNARNATCVASFLTDDCVYEDLLLGPATVCRGKAAFLNALQYHPAFISSRLLDGMPFAHLLPSLTLEVDSIAEGLDTVGVEWHVQCGDFAFPLGRGLTQARVCTATGKIERVVDIAEAPWRVIGIMLLPFISAFSALSKVLPPVSQAAAPDADEPLMCVVDVEREYSLLLDAVLADGKVEPSERALLRKYAEKNKLSDAQHAILLKRAGWSEEDFQGGWQRQRQG